MMHGLALLALEVVFTERMLWRWLFFLGHRSNEFEVAEDIIPIWPVPTPLDRGAFDEGTAGVPNRAVEDMDIPLASLLPQMDIPLLLGDAQVEGVFTERLDGE
jgi:hypothetical protein